MPEKKYAKYIVTKDIGIEFQGTPPAGFLNKMENQKRAGDFLDSSHLIGLNDRVIKGSPYFDAVWMTGLHGTHGVQVEVQHSHDFDEVLGFFGLQRELNSEIEFWLEDEQYFIDTSALVFVPKGMNHLPLYFRRIGSPVLFFTFACGSTYSRATGNE